jgi:hypothetical protein
VSQVLLTQSAFVVQSGKHSPGEPSIKNVRQRYPLGHGPSAPEPGPATSGAGFEQTRTQKPGSPVIKLKLEQVVLAPVHVMVALSTTQAPLRWPAAPGPGTGPLQPAVAGLAENATALHGLDPMSAPVSGLPASVVASSAASMAASAAIAST